MTLGGPLSQNCYQAALARDARPSSTEGCDRSLTEEALTSTDRAATFVNRGILNMIRGRETAAESDFNSAMAIDNAVLYRSSRDVALQLQRAVLPEVPPSVRRCAVAAIYRPSARAELRTSL